MLSSGRRFLVPTTLIIAVGLLMFSALPALARQASESTTVSLSVFAAVVLGLVEGITEYLPVSSTGHLLVANEILGLGGTEAADRALETYAICIQAGAILAVLVVYKERILQMMEGLVGRSEEGRRVLLAVLAAFIPTAIIAVSVFGFIRDRFFSAGPIAFAWLVGGLVIVGLNRSGFFERTGHELAGITVKQAALIGVMQTLAVWPGTSRSLVTIIAGVLVGLSLRAAVEFSFLLGLLTLAAATVYAGLNDGPEMIDTFGYVTPAIGLIVAFVSAVAAVRWMVSWLNNRGFEVFGWYRIAIGLVALAVLAVARAPI
nr:putative undecaprenyl-diphosphate phosphatase [uncultured bacterium]